MKKIFLLFICLLICNIAYAKVDTEKRADITATRQVYTVKRHALSLQLDNKRAEYLKVLEDTEIEEPEKTQKLQEIEADIVRINQEKEQLKNQYNKDKKKIKNRK